MPDERALDDLLAGLVDRLKLLEDGFDERRRGEFTPSSAFAAAPLTGTWTPFYSGSTIAGVFTYGTTNGEYARYGNRVLFTGQVGISAIGTPPTGTMRIGGLPFTSGGTYNNSVWFGRISNFKYTAAAKALTGIISTTTTLISLYEAFDNAGVVAVPAANFTNAACQLIFGGMYLAA